MDITPDDVNFDALEVNLTDLSDTIREINLEKGWRGPDAPERSFGDDIALLHSEVSEMLEAFRDHGTEMRLRFVSDGGGYSLLQEDDINAIRWMSGGAVPKPEGVGPEAADVLIRLLDLCYQFEIDLVHSTRLKLKYNATRSFRHGGKAL